MNLKLKRTPGIYVVGFMGAGKSTVGRHLAHRLGWNFFDTDAEIEAAEKTAISAIFDDARRTRIPPHRDRHHPSTRRLDRTRTGRRAGARRRRLQPARQPRPCSKTTASRSGWIAPSKPSSTAWAGPPTAPWRAIQRPSPPFSTRAATTTRLADVHIPISGDDPEVTVAAILAHPLFK